MKVLRGSRFIPLLFFNLEFKGVGGERHVPAALPLGKTECELCTKLNGPRGRFGRVRKISLPQGFDPRTLQTVASRYTDWAVPARLYPVLLRNEHIPFSQSFQIQHQTNSFVLKREALRSFEASEQTFYQKQRKNSACSWPLLCIRLLPGSNLNTETGYPDFGVSVVVCWISRKIPGFTLIRPWSHPDTFLSTRHISKLILYLFRAID